MCVINISHIFLQTLHQWRDYIAREVDESTGYVLPNKALIEIGTADLFLFLRHRT